MGRWDYSKATAPKAYGCDTTYKLGADWLRGLDVEDWGCGLGWYKQFHEGGYTGLDESPSPFASKVVGLDQYTSSVPGIFMRHVLEHNHSWRKILSNALMSFQKRMFLAVFTPLEKTERVMSTAVVALGVMVPDLALAGPFLDARVERLLVKKEVVATATRYGSETVYYLEKRQP